MKYETATKHLNKNPIKLSLSLAPSLHFCNPNKNRISILYAIALFSKLMIKNSCTMYVLYYSQLQLNKNYAWKKSKSKNRIAKKEVTFF